jgi:hypothetical protein
MEIEDVAASGILSKQEGYQESRDTTLQQIELPGAND